MKRGEVWTVASRGPYTGEPRPVVIVQGDRFDGTSSITVCVLTTNPVDSPTTRIVVEPSAANGLKATSRIMVDRITTVPRSQLGRRIGHLDHADATLLDRAMLIFLGLST